MSTHPVWFILPELWSLDDHVNANHEAWWIECHRAPGKTRIRAMHMDVSTMGDPESSLTEHMKNCIRVHSTTMMWWGHIHGGVNEFRTDLQASEWVAERMHQGSAFHTRAFQAVMKAVINGATGD